MEGLVDLSLFEWNPTGSSTAHGVSSGSAAYYQPQLSGTREYYAPSSPRHVETTGETDDLREAIRRSMNESASPATEPNQEAAKPRDSDIRETIVHASRRREAIIKPLPALPWARGRQQTADDGSESVLKQIKRTTTDSAISSPGSLLQRRNANATPQLTLSVPNESPKPLHSNQHRSGNHPPPMVWMPDEQMWLIVGDTEQRTSNATQAAYPTPPAYTPRAFASSAPSSRVTSQWDLTPPQTPIQSQLQSLLQPRDEVRLSPLFQEAMNSVPMTDHFELPPPPSYEGSVRHAPPSSFRPHTSASERFLSSTSPSSHTLPVVQRAQTTGSQRPRVRSDTSNERSNSQHSYGSLRTDVSRPPNSGRSHHSATSSRSYQSAAELSPNNSYPPVRVAPRSWHGLAQRLARPRSTT